MPDVDLPRWLDVLLIIGVVAGALSAIIILTVKVVTGVNWLGRTTQTAILAPTLQDIERLDGKLDGISRQLEEMIEKWDEHVDDPIAHHAHDEGQRRNT